MHRPIKILHCLGTLDPGGVETWLLRVLGSIDRDQFQFDFCTLGDRKGLYADEMEQLGAKVIRCPLAEYWSFGSRFNSLLKACQYQVVHSHVHLFSGVLLRWARARGVPIRVAHSHTSYDEYSDKTLRRYYRGLMLRWIQRHCTHGLAASHIAAEELFTKSWPEDDRFKVLHCGIDLALFQDSFDKDQLRNELGIPLDAPVVGHVGGFVKPKNHRFLLEIAGTILKMRPDIHFLFVGDGPLRAEIETQSRSAGISSNIHFAGTRTDIARLMRACMDAFILPSLWEGFGLVLIEAQAAGLPCIVSNAVSVETFIFHKQMFRLPLSEGKNEWATKTIDALSLRPITSPVAIETLKQTDFCIHRSTAELANLYANGLKSSSDRVGFMSSPTLADRGYKDATG
jgi:glycosyltransferase involved in cell wall biosynthesis